MTVIKRGLGRGLEALLAEGSAKVEQPQSDAYSPSQNGQLLVGQADECSATVVALFKSIQRENRILLEEAEALRQLIAEFESIIRAGQS